MMRLKVIALGFSSLLCSSLCVAAKANPVNVAGWDGEVGLGLTLSSGNTDTKNATGTLDLANDRVNWRHGVKLSALYSEDDGTRTAQRFRLASKSDYKLPENKFLFIAGSYEDDDFNAYDFQASVAVGYGWRVMEQANQVLDIEIGPGFRYSEYKAGGSEEEALLRVAGKYALEISPTAKFGQTLQVEAGKESTITRSVTSLTTAISGALSLRAAFELKHDSGAPSGSDDLDTLTSLSVVYKF